MERAVTEREPLPPDANGLCYADEQHFDETMVRIARDHLAHRAAWLERRIVPFGLAMSLVAAIGTCAALGPGPSLVILGLALTVLVAYVRRETRQAARVERESLCFGCRYSLQRARTDDAGWGTCPECGRRYHVGHFRRPPPYFARGSE
ncbi:MAG: hypothetical protein ACYTJ0_02215 [Planctomycetota bacterium]|jgi:hypothetical protein